MSGTVRLTVAQAVVRFLATQHTERDGRRQRLFAGCFGIFGHGNVAGVGQALLETELADPGALPYHLARNEQAMVHASAAYARMRNRLTTFACTASIGPGSSNMLTGAALATINRLPVLLLPSDIFATRVSSPVLQELEDPRGYDVSVNDAFRPLSVFFDRVWRPEQLPSALLGAMRTLTDQANTGAATIALPQDVQAEAHDWPVELFDERVWHIARPVPEPARVAAAWDVIRAAERPLIVAGGGVIYAEATDALRAFAEATGIPVGETQAGKGALPYDHPLALGAIGSTGTTAANALAREADVVIGIGTRYSDFTTASRTAFQDPQVRFVNINVAALDAHKHAGVPILADAREALLVLADAAQGWSTTDAYRERARDLSAEWDRTVEQAYTLGHAPLPAQSEVIGAVNELSDPRDVVVCAAGSMPGDLHKLWRTRDPKGYHVEYGYSCMGYEIAGGVGIAMAAPDRDVFVMCGDGSYLMMSSELVTAVSEGIKIIVVLVQNHGFHSIGALSEELGSQRFGTRYRYRDDDSGRLDGPTLPIDLAANAESLGVTVLRTGGLDELRSALQQAKRHTGGPVLIHIETDPLVHAPDSESWWDVPVSQVAELDSTIQAHKTYAEHKQRQRPYIAEAGQSEGHKVVRTIQHWISGQPTAGGSSRTAPVWNPATGEQQAEVVLATTADIDDAVQAAAVAFERWSQTSLSRRTKIVFAFRELINDHVSELAEIISDEHGKVLSDAKGEVQRGLEVVEFACGIPQLLKGEYSDQVSTNVDAFSYREPLGVCAGITPFNFPIMVPMWMYPVAIACGNTFVLKPSERDPSVSERVAELWAQAGLPEGVFNVVHGDMEAVDAILDHPDVAAVSFVGSTPIAKYIHGRASEHGKRVQALGGAKNHAIVLPDADLDFASDHLVAAAFGSAGERCMAISATVAVGSAGDALNEILYDKGTSVKVGPGRDPASEMGPVVTKQAQERILGYIDSGEQAGAKVTVDGRGLVVPGHEEGFWVGPTVLDHVTTDMDVYTDEIFGPVLSVVRSDTVDEAIALINANPYGNGTAIFTNSGEAARRFHRGVEVGMIGINVPVPVPMAYHSFGGWKDSLFGSSGVHGPDGVQFYTRSKKVTARWPHVDHTSGASYDMPTAD